MCKELILIPVAIILLIAYTVIPVCITYDKLDKHYNVDPMIIFLIAALWICVNCIIVYLIV
jgi:hypothetical protein